MPVGRSLRSRHNVVVTSGLADDVPALSYTKLFALTSRECEPGDNDAAGEVGDESDDSDGTDETAMAGEAVPAPCKRPRPLSGAARTKFVGRARRAAAWKARREKAVAAATAAAAAVAAPSPAPAAAGGDREHMVAAHKRRAAPPRHV